MFVLITQFKHVSKRLHIHMFAMKAFLHEGIFIHYIHFASINQYHLVDYIQMYFEDN